MELSKELSDLIYLSAVKFKEFEDATGNGWEMSSFAEKKHEKVRHAAYRVYVALVGTRVTFEVFT